jgi:hypothetical protein
VERRTGPHRDIGPLAEGILILWLRSFTFIILKRSDLQFMDVAWCCTCFGPAGMVEVHPSSLWCCVCHHGVTMAQL